MSSSLLSSISSSEFVTTMMNHLQSIEYNEVIDWAVAHWARLLITFILLIVALEHLTYWYKKSSLPGPTFFWPFIGSIVTMVLHPYEFWHGQFDLGKLSANTLVGQFVVVSSDADITRNILLNSSEEMPLILHPNAYKLLGKNNMAFMNGPYHKELRRRLLPLFTEKALSVYLKLQQEAIHDYLQLWFKMFQQPTSSSYKEHHGKDGGLKMKSLIWDLNCHTSMSVFLGPYLDRQLRNDIQYHYKRLTDGFLAFPLDLPGTTLNNGVKSKKLLIPLLEQIVKKSKASMKAGNEPACLLDFWMVNTVKEIDECAKNGQERPPHSSDNEVANITLDFLFASQDASTASLTWAVDTLCRYPDVLAKIREEQSQLRPNNEVITLELMISMKYTNQVMKEILRQYPPATMVPHIANKDLQLADYNVHRGSLIIPSIYSACHQGYPDANKFDPDRFSAERDEGNKYSKNFLTFGIGPHACLGQRYAQNHLCLFLSIMAMETELKRHWSPKAHTMMYAPTIYPADECIMDNVQPFKH